MRMDATEMVAVVEVGRHPHPAERPTAEPRRRLPRKGNFPMKPEGEIAVALRRLVRRFRRAADCRDDEAYKLRTKGDIHLALNMENGAAAYTRSADEIERVISGEMPPSGDSFWPPNAHRSAAEAAHE